MAFFLAIALTFFFTYKAQIFYMFKSISDDFIYLNYLNVSLKKSAINLCGRFVPFGTSIRTLICMIKIRCIYTNGTISSFPNPGVITLFMFWQLSKSVYKYGYPYLKSGAINEWNFCFTVLVYIGHCSNKEGLQKLFESGMNCFKFRQNSLLFCSFDQ